MQNSGQSQPSNEQLGRILMLVPHLPSKDPRIAWVAELCAQIARTDVIGFVLVPGEKVRTYDGRVYTESAYLYNPTKALLRYRLLLPFRALLHPKKAYRRIIRDFKGLLGIPSLPPAQSSPPPPPAEVEGSRPVMRLRSTPIRHIVSLIRLLMIYYYIYDTLYRRARANSIAPQLIVCHDIYALSAGVKLKQHFGCRLLYDTHELWPEADLKASLLEKKLTTYLERRLIQQTDVVITVTPQIARHLEQLYEIDHVVAVPNAVPTHTVVDVTPSFEKEMIHPVQFLLQGGISPGRGIEELLDMWAELQEKRAALTIRGPDNEFLEHLRDKFSDAISVGLIRIDPPVTEEQLVAAASSADVGIIPYSGPNLNHLYACPNKLSQYMHAGLAIMSNTDMQFVSEKVRCYRCGVTYDLGDFEQFRAVVERLVENSDQLEIMKKNAWQAAQKEFNWEAQSHEYFSAIQKLYDPTGVNR